MPSEYPNILADIKTRMETVSDIGIIFDYERWSNNWTDFINFFLYTTLAGVTIIRGWEITRRGFHDQRKGAYLRNHRFEINGYMGLEDATASEKVFQGLLDLLCDAFREGNDPLGRWYYLDEGDDNGFPFRVDPIESRMFGNILCHYAKIELNVAELRL